MRELDISQIELSQELGMSVSTLNEKINGNADFKFTELVKIADYLGIDQKLFQKNPNRDDECRTVFI
jgi:transcriptional regulator with XRE-family HTH domain